MLWSNLKQIWTFYFVINVNTVYIYILLECSSVIKNSESYLKKNSRLERNDLD